MLALNSETIIGDISPHIIQRSRHLSISDIHDNTKIDEIFNLFQDIQQDIQIKSLIVKRCKGFSNNNLIGLRSLEKLSLFNCDNLSEIPNTLVNLTDLTIRECNEITMYSLPLLKRLTLTNVSLNTIDNKLQSLESLHLDDSYLDNRTNDFESDYFTNLKELTLKDVDITEIPNFTNLERLTLESCNKLQEIPDFTNLKELTLKTRNELQNIPDFTNLERLTLENVDITEIPDFTNLENITENLKELKLKDLDITEIPNFTNLERLELIRCIELQKIPNFKNLESLELIRCGEFLKKIPNLKKVTYINITNCPNLKTVEINNREQLRVIIQNLENRGMRDNNPMHGKFTIDLLKKRLANITRKLKLIEVKTIQNVSLPHGVGDEVASFLTLNEEENNGKFYEDYMKNPPLLTSRSTPLIPTVRPTTRIRPSKISVRESYTGGKRSKKRSFRKKRQ